MKRYFVPGLAAIGLLLGLSVPRAHADTIQFTEANSGILGNGTVASPYANLTITGNTTTGVLTFSIDTAGNPATFKDFGFNLAPGVSTSDFTMQVTSSSGGDITGYGLSGSGTMDGFGQFVEITGDSGGQANRLSTITFELDFIAGKEGEAVPSNVEVVNSSGFYFALEYFPTSGGTGFVAVNTLTGGGGGGGGTLVPEPSSVVLLGLGSIGLMGCFYRIRRRAIA